MWLITPKVIGHLQVVQSSLKTINIVTPWPQTAHILKPVCNSEQNGILCDSILYYTSDNHYTWPWGIWVSSSFKNSPLKTYQKSEVLQKGARAHLWCPWESPSQQVSVCADTCYNPSLTTPQSKDSELCFQLILITPWGHTPSSSRSCSQARDETWPKWVITENKTREGFWIVKLLGQQESTAVFTSPEEKLKCDRVAAGLGRGECFSEKTKEQELLVLNFQL